MGWGEIIVGLVGSFNQNTCGRGLGKQKHEVDEKFQQEGGWLNTWAQRRGLKRRGNG